MKVKRLRGADVDVLYKVNPKNLSIKVCYTSTAAEQGAESTTTFECFSFERIVVKPEVPEQIEQLPAFIDGMFYFASEDEAQDFVRKQIGM